MPQVRFVNRRSIKIAIHVQVELIIFFEVKGTLQSEIKHLPFNAIKCAKKDAGAIEGWKV